MLHQYTQMLVLITNEKKKTINRHHTYILSKHLCKNILRTKQYFVNNDNYSKQVIISFSCLLLSSAYFYWKL